MTRRIKRHKAFEIILDIKDEGFINTSREHQRNWFLARALKEMAEDLLEVDRVAGELIPGGDPIDVEDREQAVLSDEDIMEDWQIPVMQAMADLVCSADGDMLEIGFGRGVASTMIQDAGVGSHTIVECNGHVIAQCEEWKTRYPGRDIRIIEGLWQDVTEQMGNYDGIFFHTYPLSEEEYLEHVAQGATFAGHFFSTAEAHLKAGGAFTYLTTERDSLSRAHQRLLLDHFSSFSLSMIRNLDIPANSRDAHWSQQMVLVKAVK